MTIVASAVVPLDISKAVEQLKRDEGFSRFLHKDSVGVLTIGYGIDLQSDGLSQDEAALVLQHRAWKQYRDLITALPWVKYLDEARQGVLLNMAYSLGVVGELKFHITLDDVHEGRFAAAADAMRASEWAREVSPRAERLAVQMETGEWQ